MKLQDGEKIEHYRLLNRLGNGGMSDVFRALDEKNNREVTLKFPHEEMMGDPATYERFQREVRIGQELTHPHIQKLYELAGGRRPFMVLEYVPGGSLRGILAEEWRAGIPLRERIAKAQNMGVQIARALAYAHEKGVIHRDMKPENVLVTPEGYAKVMDFGIAFIAGARRVTYGSLSTQVGTPDYMAPEQIKGQRGDHRTDIYALGMMLYEMVTGEMPYDGDNPLAIMSQHVTEPAPALSEKLPEVPVDLEEVILKAIRRDANNRWPSMAAFADALEHPETVDAEVLKAERLEQEGKSTGGRPLNKTGTPLTHFQIGLVVVAAFLCMGALGVLLQLIQKHH